MFEEDGAMILVLVGSGAYGGLVSEFIEDGWFQYVVDFVLWLFS